VSQGFGEGVTNRSVRPDRPLLPRTDIGQTDRGLNWDDIFLDVRRFLFVLGKVLRYGVFPLAGWLPVPAYRRNSFAVRLRHCLEDLGLTYLKLGQFLALRFDILPAEVCLELNRLFESVAPMPLGTARAIVESELGAPIGDLFAEFSPEPVAAASVAQVHDARLPSGARVAVKVQRSGLERIFRADVRNLRRAATVAQALGAFGRLSVTGMVAQFSAWTLREMDFRIEGRTAERVRAESEPTVLIN
jgi:ubiquinone biosynthesis protein